MGKEVAREWSGGWMFKCTQKGNFSNLLCYVGQRKPQEAGGICEGCVGRSQKRGQSGGGCVEARRAEGG